MRDGRVLERVVERVVGMAVVLRLSLSMAIDPRRRRLDRAHALDFRARALLAKATTSSSEKLTYLVAYLGCGY